MRVSVPGSIMLMGEHAVLGGETAIVTAINKRIHVTLTPRQNDSLSVTSHLGFYETHLSALSLKPPFTYVLSAIQTCRPYLTRGFELDIRSDMPDSMGLGSSTAVTVATVASLLAAQRPRVDNLISLIFSSALKAIRSVQGIGSGADVAASLYGGVQSYCANPLTLTSLPWSKPLHLFYSGKKTKTQTVIAYVAQRFADTPEILKDLYQCIGRCSRKAADALLQGDWPTLCAAVKEGQTCMEKLGVCDETLAEMVSHFSAEPSVEAVKISGSGLGDCLYVLGEPDVTKSPYPYIRAEIEHQGLCWD